MQTRPKQSPFDAATSVVGTTTRVRPADLRTFFINPRRGAVTEIAGSLKNHGQYKPITVNVGTYTGRPNEVLAGNHTLIAFRTLADDDPNEHRWDEILVHWVDVDDDEAKRIVAVDNRTSELGTNDAEQLAELLGSLPDLTGTGYGSGDLDALVDALAGAGSDPSGDPATDPDAAPLYSDKVDVPHYTPSDNPPTIAELLDVEKTRQLLGEIAGADLPADVKEMLALCAYRHTRINFHRMADYYASAPPAVQQLMENSALVIIDIDDAIRHGYVRLTNALRETLAADRADGADEIGDDA